jgi:hypothetical protein
MAKTTDRPTLSDQLDTMLLSWLAKHAAARGGGRPDQRATAVMSVADPHVREMERLCEKWGLSVARRPHQRPLWSVLTVSGPALPVLGLTEIANQRRASSSA